MVWSDMAWQRTGRANVRYPMERRMAALRLLDLFQQSVRKDGQLLLVVVDDDANGAQTGRRVFCGEVGDRVEHGTRDFRRIPRPVACSVHERTLALY